MAQSDTLAERIVIIGDAGQLNNGRHPVVDAVRRYIPLDQKTSIFFLGDNLYKSGLPDPEYTHYEKYRAILDSQLSLADNGIARIWMIPGNHDWENGGPGGFEAIVRQQQYTDQYREGQVKFEPENGCPGPVKVEIGKNIVFILFDSQWWLHPHDKPGLESDCSSKTKEELLAQISDLAARNADKLIVMACHHPFKSNGIHGGYFTLKQHLFPFTDIRKNLYIPLPLLGSVYPISRSVFGVLQDMSHPSYTDMIERVTAAVKKSAPNVVFVSGHDHNLQHIRENGTNYIVSGGGCKQNRTSKNKNSLFNTTAMGFAVMEVSTRQNVTLSFYTVADTVQKAYTGFLLNFSPGTTLANNTNEPVSAGAVVSGDSVSRAASSLYSPLKGTAKWFRNQNYRREWSTPVQMKVLRLAGEKGGLRVESLGGGQQTLSLRLRDAAGKEWTLRSVNKSVSPPAQEVYRGTPAEKLLPEINAATHPYGALVVPPLARALGLQTPDPRLVFVADDTLLGRYRSLFAGTVCMLEERNTGTKDTRSTAKAFDKMLDDNDHRADQYTVLKARLLDMIIGDYDRHLDQWRWEVLDSAGRKGKMYSPIPRDRDQAFFHAGGSLLKWVSSQHLPQLTRFAATIGREKWLGYQARDFDRLFLTEQSEENWEKAIDEVQRQLPDEVIRQAVRQLPPEIFALNGEKLEKNLISRRNQLRDAALRYYRYTSRHVNVTGSNQREYFKVSNDSEGLRIRVYERSKTNDTNFLLYNRVFDPSVTREVRLFGLNGNDRFEIEDNTRSRIKIRMVGGKGSDTFLIAGQVKNLLYDLDNGQNHIARSSRTRNMFSSTPPVNETTLMGFRYNRTRFPQWRLGYNSDDGWMTGIGFHRQTHGFRNLPYATDQRFSALMAPERKAYQVQYRGEFNHVFRSTDLLVQANFVDPAIRNFTGLGNNTAAGDGKNLDFYRVRYRNLETELLLRKRFFERLHLMAGPYFYRYWNRYNDNRNNILANPRAVGLDSADVFSKKSWLGLKMAMQFDNRNHPVFPTRGIFWNNEFLATAGSGTGANSYTRFSTDMTIYASMRENARAVVVIGLGGGKIYSRHYEFFQAMTLGINNSNLHGFRKNRYSGRSSLYSSAELRLKLFDIRSAVAPGPFGITTFYDIGRVWVPGEISRRWHSAWGYGFYFLPFNNMVVAASAGFSEKERLLQFNLGTKLNLTF